MNHTLALLTALLLAPLAALHAAGNDATVTKLDIQYKSTEQGPLYLDVYCPAARKASAKYPLVIYTHGGGWVTGSRKNGIRGNLGKVVSGLTAQGFCVALVDYRLWVKDGSVTVRDCVIDSKDAVRYLVKNAERLALDPNRVFTFGDSAGGQIAQMLLLTPPAALPGEPALTNANYRMIAGVSWYGPCDFEKTELFNPDGRADFRDRFGPRILKPGADPKDKLAAYREISPVNYLKPDSPPLLMIQGDKDTAIPVHLARYMKERAAAVQAPVEILIIDNAGHNWREVGGALHPSADEIVEKTVAFLKQHLDRCSKQ